MLAFGLSDGSIVVWDNHFGKKGFSVGSHIAVDYGKGTPSGCTHCC